MPDWNAIGAFIGAVLAWPGDNDPGYANLQWSFVDKRTPGGRKPDGKYPIAHGAPFREPGQMLSRASWINSSGYCKDVWFCTSLQRETSRSNHGKVIAKRSSMGALLQKSIWIDADVGANDPRKYATVEDALRAILTFQTTTGLPRPSAIVFSGNGLHVYWISQSALTPQEWQPYASGLKNMLLANNIKCDAGLTTDIARILRMPGTFNHKTDPAKPVELSPLPLKLYDFEKDLAAVKPFAGPTVTPSGIKPAASLFADGVDPASFRVTPVLAPTDRPEDDLGAGIDKFADYLVAATPIFKHCGFYKDALKTEGATFTQPLWNLSVLGATFMENGNAIAHAISKGHAEYTEVDTQALYDRKMAERHDRGLGYPSCAAIKANGCSACAACPLWGKGKSPLNIRPVVTATVTPAMGQSQSAAQLHLPAGYDVNQDGIICKVIEPVKDGETLPPVMIPLFQAQLSGFRLTKDPGEQLEFKATADKGHVVEVSLELGQIGGLGFTNYILKKRLLYAPEGEKYLKEFFLSLIGKIRALMAAQVSVPYGWYEEDSKVVGFAYGGKLYMKDGIDRPSSVTDQTLAAKYRPKGSIEPWLKALRTVTDRKRPELTSIVLLAFASPLLALNGKNTACLAAFGNDSGAGKTSATRVGVSVWGHPLANKLTNRDTANSIMGTMTKLRHLPFYWDEVKEDKYKQKFSEVLTELDGGKEKARMLSGTEHQESGLFQLMLMYTGNASIVEYLRKHDGGSVAPWMRVLEYGPVKRINFGPGHMMDADAEIILNECQRNYGHMGALYAKFLATNVDTIREEFRLKCNEVQRKLGGGNTERYWYTTVAVMYLAAKYAKQLGVDCDPDEIEAFQSAAYKANDAIREAYAPGGDADNSEDAMTRYLRDRETVERGIWTDRMFLLEHRPPKGFIVNRVHGPLQPKNTAGAITFRYAQENMILAFDKKDFERWLDEDDKSSTTIYNDLAKYYTVQQRYLTLMSGLTNNAGRQKCIVLHIRPGAPLWEHLLAWASPVDRERITALALANMPKRNRPPPDEPDDTPDDDPDDIPADEAIDTGFELVTNAAVQSWINGAKRA